MERGNRWGPEGPPDDAYSRITEPERFAPLHDHASALLDRLEAEYEVDAEEGVGIDPELERGEPARPTRRLVPRSPNAAPIAIGFTTFPGLMVRFGRWQVGPFPTCGCDACDETYEREAEHLEQLIEAVTSGGFSESIRPAPFGNEVWLDAAYRYTGGSESGGGIVDLSRFERMKSRDKRRFIEWEPWPRRSG